MTIKHLLAVLGFIALFGCETVEIQDNRRIVVTGQVQDLGGNARQGIEVGVRANDVLLGVDESDTNGNFQVLSLEAEDASLVFRVGTREFNSGITFAEYIVNENPSLRETNVYDLGVVTIAEVARLDITIEKEANSTAESLAYNLTYQDAGCVVTIQDGTITDDSNCYAETVNTRMLDTENPETSLSILSLVGTTAQFEFTVDDNPSETITITLNEEENAFTFTY